MPNIIVIKLVSPAKSAGFFAYRPLIFGIIIEYFYKGSSILGLTDFKLISVHPKTKFIIH